MTGNAAIRCDAVSKKFSGKYAVHRADLVVQPGTIHALVGENGAGKSTLLGMISGRLASDEGVVSILGEELRSQSPRDVRRHGIVAVYQELTMVPALSATENVFLGQLRTKGGVTSDRAMRSRFLQLCKEFDVTIDPDAAVRTLSIAHQQILEIMRGVQADGRIILLDEPSAALAEGERDVLHRILRQVNARGTTIVFVSHNLDEVLLLSDHITVMRDSEVVAGGPRADWDKKTIVRAMVGKDVAVERRTERHALGEMSFDARQVTLPGALEGISIRARQGEIVGLWGLVGSGRTPFFRSICGLEPRSRGELSVHGKRIAWPRSMRSAMRAGIAMVPESRRDALVMGMDAVANYWIGRRTPGRGLLNQRREKAEAADRAAAFGMNPARIQESVRRLSGGNQQKVVLMKWAGHRPSVLLVDEPTRGIDIGAKTEVLGSLVRLAAEGATIVVTSSELEEVLAICDRLYVFTHGTIGRELDIADGDYSVEEIIKIGFGEGEAAS